MLLHYLNSSAKNSQPTYNIIWYNSSYNSKPFGDLLGNIFIYNSTKILTYLTLFAAQTSEFNVTRY